MTGGWDALARLGVTIRPLRNPPPLVGAHSKFRAPLTDTIKILAVELRHLDAEGIVLEAGFLEKDLRLDGLPRADARLGTPSLALSFTTPYGPLRYATGEYKRWEDNLRAIALSLEALRAVDRHGVSKRGEQYKGWAQLPTSTDPADQIVTEEQALSLLARYQAPEDTLEDALKNAMKRSHPDRGGTSTLFRQVMKAKEVLGL